MRYVTILKKHTAERVTQMSKLEEYEEVKNAIYTNLGRMEALNEIRASKNLNNLAYNEITQKMHEAHKQALYLQGELSKMTYAPLTKKGKK